MMKPVKEISDHCKENVALSSCLFTYVRPINRRTKRLNKTGRTPLNSHRTFTRWASKQVITILKLADEGATARGQEDPSAGQVVPGAGRRTRARTQTPPHRTLRYDPDLEANEVWKGEWEQVH